MEIINGSFFFSVSKLVQGLVCILFQVVKEKMGKEERMNGMTRKRLDNRKGSLGYPRFVKPLFTKDSKLIGRRKRSLGHLGIATPVLTYRSNVRLQNNMLAIDDSSYNFEPCYVVVVLVSMNKCSRYHWIPSKVLITASAILGASGLYRSSRKESLRGTIPIFSNFVATVGHSKM
ncbi:hypothetical protein TNCV_4597671 [Trichonephila clavipes]|nr:hypothetical protein TNCV_4597671 [Trichonephila clavipes]